MKKKHIRKIVVNGIEYIWAVPKANCDGDGGHLLRIWNNKKIICEKIMPGCSITPKEVSEIIKGLNQ